MPTTEERLAALETKLAALTETTPTTYYEHQYSGEEIDAAVGRALTGGALDTSVTNVSNQLGTFVRPNLLDNWHFGNPVDQRGGYIVPKGVNYYKVDGFVPQGPIPETVKVDHIDSAGSAIFNYGGAACYVPKDGGYVRGYTGNGYTVDRWIYDKQITISNGISLLADSFFYQKLEQSTMDALNGKQITFSALTTSNSFLTGSWVVDNTIQSDTRIAENNEFILFRSPWTGTGWGIYSRIATQILAAKLELGPTQTLAHQENGVWVLNEVPEYGEQLRRCQWYSNVLPGIYWLPQNADGTNRLTIPIPDMRTIPAVTYEPVDGSTGTLYYDANLAQKNSIQFYAIGVTGICGVKNIRISADL